MSRLPGRLPALFVSHGSPMLALEDGPAHRFLKEYGAAMARPKAILVASAHWETPVPAISLAAQPETIHDFGGFPRALFEMRYPAPGAPEVAARAAQLLDGAGLECRAHPSRGLDHGAWVPLGLMFPEADIPVAQVAIQPHLGPSHQMKLGEALAPLRDEGVLIMASGSLTHNLMEIRRTAPDSTAPEWVSAFESWIAETVEQNRRDDLLDYRRLAPHAARNHPTDEHLQPLFVALGAGGPGGAGRRIHASQTYGVLAMDAYAFE